jgi:hypothetical protein
MPRYKLIPEKTCDDFLNDLCNAVGETLKQQEKSSLLDDRLAAGIRSAVKQVLTEDLRVSDSCGLSTYCTEENQAPPWSSEEAHLKKEGI